MKKRFVDDAQAKITIVDLSDFDASGSINGGNYAYSTIYERTFHAMWKVTYETSAEFDFCPFCGQFGRHFDEDGEPWCEQKLVPTKEVEVAIRQALQNEKFEVYFD